MRSLLLILKILIATSLLMQPVETMASAAKVNSGKKGLKKNILRDTGNVWDRIRIGMQIPRYFPGQAVAVRGLPASVNTALPQKNLLIKTTVVPLNHDESNRTRLHNIIIGPNTLAKNKSKLSPKELNKQIGDYVNNNLPESSAVGGRIRTRLDFHPRADKLNAKASVEELVAKREPLIVETVTTAKDSKMAKSLAEKEQGDVKLVTVNDRISKHIAWYSQRPGYLKQVAERARPYLYHIVSQLNAHHLPAELALLPIVESAYQPTALSPKSAAGLWQFIPSTGLDFDLSQNERYDDRLDIEASTQAAIRFLSQLKNHFNGDWLLALAAYNCGQGRVDDAISSNRANGLPTDYWSLHLPEETQEYVPRFLALANIFANPKNYGVKLPAVKNEPYYVRVKVDRKFDIDYLSKKHLTAIAEMANLSYEQFVLLNPGYLKSTLETDRPFTLLLPANNANQLNQHLRHIALFLAEPSILMTKSTAQNNIPTEDDPKNLPVAVTSSLADKQPVYTSPLLTLILKPNQTTPRIANQPPVITDIRAITLGLVQAKTLHA